MNYSHLRLKFGRLCNYENVSIFSYRMLFQSNVLMVHSTQILDVNMSANVRSVGKVIIVNLLGVLNV